MASPSWESWGIHTAHPLLCTPHQSRDRGVATLGQSVQSPFSQEIKKNIQLGWHPGWARQWPIHPGTSGLLCKGQQHPQGASRPPQSRISAAGDGSLEQQGEALVGPTRAWLAALMVCFFGTWDKWLAAESGGNRPLGSSQVPWARMAVAYGVGEHCPRRWGCGALEGRSGVRGPAPMSLRPGSPSRRQRCLSSWFCAR